MVATSRPSGSQSIENGSPSTAGHDLAVPVGVEGQHLAGQPVAHPEPAVVPPRRLAHLIPVAKISVMAGTDLRRRRNSSGREARPGDLPLLKGIEDAADQTFVAVFGPLDWEPATSGEWRARQPGFLLVAEVDEDVVGFAHVLRLEGTAHLEQLAVHPDHHRRGIGTALLRAAMDRAAAEGYDRLTLSTYAEVPWNAPFYRATASRS